MKPGTVKIFDEAGKVTKTVEHKLIYSDQWQKFEGKKDETTRPHLGNNLYAADREKPPVPWKPNTKEAKAMEEVKAKVNQA